MRYARTALLLAAMTGLFLAIGYLLGGTGGMMIAFLIALGMNAFAYWNSDKMVLRMYGAKPVDRTTAPELYNIVAQLARRAEIPMPRLYIIDEAQPNAFATGRNPDNAAVAATSGLLRILDRDEIEGVLAHELAHVKNRDTLIMTITATLAGAISMLANFALFFGGSRNNPLGIVGAIALMILAPVAAMMVQMAISRTREYSADRIGSQICGKPLALASALSKLQNAAGRTDNRRAEENPATAHMFIVNPLHARNIDSLFSTHPSTENRIAALRELAGETSGGGGAAPSPRTARPRRSGRSGRSGRSSVPAAGRRGRRSPW